MSVLNYLNQIKEDNLDLIKRYILRSLNDIYIYYEIAKNPPQPDFDKNYYDKVDIEKSFDEINITNISYYQFFQKVKAKLSDYKDINTNIYFFQDNKKLYILNDLYSFIPIKFNIRKINESYEIFSELYKKENFINY
jgi:hypothetical protein